MRRLGRRHRVPWLGQAVVSGLVRAGAWRARKGERVPRIRTPAAEPQGVFSAAGKTGGADFGWFRLPTLPYCHLLAVHKLAMTT